MKEQQRAQQEGQAYLDYTTGDQNSKSRTILSRYGSTQTLAMGPELASTPGDSTVAFASLNECDAQQPAQDEQQYSARQHKPSAPPTGPSSNVELIPPTSPSRAAPGWLLFLDRHWNPLVCLWITLSLLGILVLLMAVPTEPLQPAGAAMGMNTIRLRADGCASADRSTDAVALAIAGFDTALPLDVNCWSNPSNATRTAPGLRSSTGISSHTQAQAQPRAQVQARPHQPLLSREHLCLLLVALTLLLLPLPGYILVAGCWWTRLGQHHKKMKQSKATRVAPQLVGGKK